MNGPCTNVWLAHPDSLSVALIDAAASSILSQRERGRSKRFCFERDRVQYVVAHALARTAIARVAGCRPRDLFFGEGPYGRPIIHGPDSATPLSFNLSHTRGLVGIALTSRGPVGFDIECLQRDLDPLELGKIVLTCDELSELDNLAPQVMREQFLRFWVLKESYLKARGTGFFISPQSFSFRVENDSVLFYPPNDDKGQWTFRLLTISLSHIAAVCTCGRDEGTEVHDGTDLLTPMLQTSLHACTPESGAAHTLPLSEAQERTGPAFPPA